MKTATLQIVPLCLLLCAQSPCTTEPCDTDDWTQEQGDCDDCDSTVYPGAPELCDGKDNDCDGAVDDGTPVGSGSACPGASCLDILNQGASVGDGLYWIDPVATGAFEAYCDMTNDGGGWTLVVSVPNGSTGDHRNPEAVGLLTAPLQSTTAKLSDTLINALRGTDYSNSILLMWTLDGKKDYFRESRPFNALGYTDSINTVYGSYGDAIALSGACFGTYHTTYHTGLVGWDCYDYMIYADNPGMRAYDYQAGVVYVKTVE